MYYMSPAQLQIDIRFATGLIPTMQLGIRKGDLVLAINRGVVQFGVCKGAPQRDAKHHQFFSPVRSFFAFDFFIGQLVASEEWTPCILRLP